MPRQLNPLHILNDAAAYCLGHAQGVLVMLQNERREVEIFSSKRCHSGQGWLQRLGKTWRNRIDCSGPIRNSNDFFLPKVNESCEVTLLNKGGTVKESEWWDAEQVDNPAALLGLPEEAHRLAAFEVMVPNNIPEGPLWPLQGDPDYPDYSLEAKDEQKELLSNKKAVGLNVKLRHSEATKDAELGTVPGR